MFSAFLICALAASFAHSQEEDEFAKRAYGYFSTLPEKDLPKIRDKYGAMLLKRTVEPVVKHLDLVQTNWKVAPVFSINGISGMARLSSDKLLIAHDSKDQDGHTPRLSIIDTSVPQGNDEAVREWHWARERKQCLCIWNPFVPSALTPRANSS